MRTKLQKAQSGVHAALGVFRTAHLELCAANARLHQVHVFHKDQAREHGAQAEQARKEVAANDAVIEKIAEFLPPAPKVGV